MTSHMPRLWLRHFDFQPLKAQADDFADLRDALANGGGAWWLNRRQRFVELLAAYDALRVAAQERSDRPLSDDTAQSACTHPACSCPSCRITDWPEGDAE